MKPLPVMAAVVALALCLVFAAPPCVAASPAPRPKLIVLISEQLRWEDFRAPEAPNLRRLAGLGALGLMNVRTARATAREGAYLTLGAGSRAFVETPPDLGVASLEGFAFEAGERWQGRPIADRYAAQEGRPLGRSQVAHLGVPLLVRQNAKLHYDVPVGLLGRYGQQFRVACLGNADTSRGLHREIAAFAMDDAGRVARGEVGADLNSLAPERPYGEVTDARVLLSKLEALLGENNCVAVQYGDASRLADWQQFLAKPALEKEKKLVLGKLDRIVKAILDKILPEHPGCSLLLLSPTAAVQEDEERLVALAPAVFYSPSRPGGQLTSPSTRSPWIIANTDIAPSILDFFGVPTPPELIGRPVQVKGAAGEANLDKVQALMTRIEKTEYQRPMVVKPVAIGFIFLLVFCAIWLLLPDPLPRFLLRLARGLLLGWLAVFVVFLVGSQTVAASPEAEALVLGGGTVLLTILASVFGKGMRAVYLLSAALVLVLGADLLTGQSLLRTSLLSYSPAGGARYYGIGNEYGGAILAAALLTVAGLLERESGRRRRWAAAGLLAVVILLVGHPALGAKFGTTLSCGVAFLFAWLYLLTDRPKARHLLIACGILVALAAALLLFDSLRGGERSHVGQLVQAVRQEGFSQVTSVILRKTGMNLHLVRVSYWSDVLLAALAVLGLALLVRPAKVTRALAGRPWLTFTLWAIVLGAAASFVFNDSGVVAAAICLSFGAVALCYATLRET